MEHMGHKVLAYVISIDVKYEEVTDRSERSVREITKDTGEGADRDRQYGWVKPPAGELERNIKTETIYTQTVPEVSVGDITAVVNGTMKTMADMLTKTLEGK